MKRQYKYKKQIIEYLRWKENMSENVINEYIHNTLTQWVSIHIKLIAKISVADLIKGRVF